MQKEEEEMQEKPIITTRRQKRERQIEIDYSKYDKTKPLTLSIPKRKIDKEVLLKLCKVKQLLK